MSSAAGVPCLVGFSLERKGVSAAIGVPKAAALFLRPHCASTSSLRMFSSHSCASRRSARVLAQGKGFGSPKKEKQSWIESQGMQKAISEQRKQQVEATELLSKLVSAGDRAHQVAEEHVDSLTQGFFDAAAAYLTMSEREGDREVSERIREALRVAMEAKQSTLRPEIQLLNRLLASETDIQTKQILNSRQAGEALVSDDRYFFRLLGKFEEDVRRTPESASRKDLLMKLEAIRRDALARIPS